MSLLGALSAAAKFNKVFSLVSLGLDLSQLGVQTAQMVDPDSVCEAWHVKDKAKEVAEKGRTYDQLFDQVVQFSANLDNTGQMTRLLWNEFDMLAANWNAVDEIRTKLEQSTKDFKHSYPAAHAWFKRLASFTTAPSDAELQQMAGMLKLDPAMFGVGVGMTGVTVIGMAAMAVYRVRTGRPIQPNAPHALTTRGQKLAAVGIIATTLTNLGSFAMNIFLFVNLGLACEAKSKQLAALKARYEEGIAPMKDLIDGCGTDAGKLNAVVAWVTKTASSADQPDSDITSDTSKDLYKVGMKAELNQYNVDTKNATTGLDALYTAVKDAFEAAERAGVKDGLTALGDLRSYYPAFVAAKDKVNDSSKPSSDRLRESQAILQALNKSLASTTNQVVEQCKGAFVDMAVMNTLRLKAETLKKYPDMLRSFMANKAKWVADMNIIGELNNAFPGRRMFTTKSVPPSSVEGPIGDLIEAFLKDMGAIH
jgi:hypothetical protein